MDVYCSSSLGPIVLTFEAIYELGWTIASLNQVTSSIHICGWLCLVTTPFGAAGSLPIRSAMAMKKKENQFTGLHRISWVCLKIACSKISGYYYMFLHWNCQKIGVFSLLDKPKDGWLSAAKGYGGCHMQPESPNGWTDGSGAEPLHLFPNLTGWWFTFVCVVDGLSWFVVA